MNTDGSRASSLSLGYVWLAGQDGLGFSLAEGTLRASEETHQLNDAEAGAVSGPHIPDPVPPSLPGCVLNGKGAARRALPPGM